MKKRTGILCLILAILLLAGCGKAAEPETTAQTGSNTPSEQTEAAQVQTEEGTQETEAAQALPTDAPVQEENIRLDVVVGQYSQESAQWWQDFEAQFEEENPDVDLTIDVASWFEMDTTVEALIEQGQAPDILNATTAIGRSCLWEGLLLPAEVYLSDETRAGIYPRFLNGCQANGTTWGLPAASIPWVMIYNPDMLDAAGVSVPSDWAELESVCKALKGAKPGVLPWGVDFLDADCFLLYTLNNGGGLVDENGEWFLNSDENLEAVQFLTRMTNLGLANKDGMTGDWVTLREMYVQEEVAMMLIPMSGLSYWENGECAVPCEIAPIPANTGSESMSLANVDCFFCLDNGQSEQELDAIRRFFDFFYQDQRHMDYVSTENLYPVTSGAANLMEQADPNMALLNEILASAYMPPHLKDGWVDLWWNLSDYMRQVLEDGENPARLLDELQYELTGR